MDLVVRPIELRDFPACLDFLRGRLAYSDDALTDLQRAWRRLLRDDALIAAVLETDSASRSPSLVAFGVSVFVTDAWMADARTGREPYLAVRTLERELAGDSPILRPADILRHNAAGLNLVNLHYGEAAHLSDEQRLPVRYRMFSALIEMTRGYFIKDLVQEWWDEMPPEYVVNVWGRVVTDYRSFFEERGEALPPMSRRPHLVGLTREEALAKPGDFAAPIFVHAPPRLGFTSAEQRMLRQALQGRTDAQLTRCLGLALPTIKSRWRTIYDRVGRIAPEVLPEIDASHAPMTFRKQEKRRQLLEYVRRHPEELRTGLSRTARAPS